MADPLAGCGVLVTRPQPQARTLQADLEALGATVFCFPSVEIHPCADADHMRESVGGLDQYDMVIFISANAVTHGLDVLGGIPDRTMVAAVGSTTAQTLRAAGHEVEIEPREGMSSEALLAEQALRDVNGRRILIVRGDGGRELLGHTLHARGAIVTYAEVYSRQRPHADPSALEEYWTAGQIDIAVFTSGATLENLHALLSDTGRELLRATPAVVPSERVVKIAASLGLAHSPIVAAGADNEAIVKTLVEWWRTGKVMKQGNQIDRRDN